MSAELRPRNLQFGRIAEWAGVQPLHLDRKNSKLCHLGKMAFLAPGTRMDKFVVSQFGHCLWQMAFLQCLVPVSEPT